MDETDDDELNDVELGFKFTSLAVGVGDDDIVANDVDDICDDVVLFVETFVGVVTFVVSVVVSESPSMLSSIF